MATETQTADATPDVVEPSELVSYARDAGRWLFLVDVLGVCGASLIAMALHRSLGLATDLTPRSSLSHDLLFVTYDVLLVLRLGMARQYETHLRFNAVDDLLVVMRSAFHAAAVAVFIALLTKGMFTGFTDYSRRYVAAAVIVPLLPLIAIRIEGRLLQKRAFRRGHFLARSLIIGEGHRATEFLEWLGRRPRSGLLPTHSSVSIETTPEQYERDLIAEVEQLRPQEIVLAFEHPLPELQHAIMRQAAFRGIAVKTLPGVFDTPDSTYLDSHGQPITTLVSTPRGRFAHKVKSVVDLFGAAVGLLLLSPVFIGIAVAIWLEDRGPIFYRQVRTGYRGRPFGFWKFHTMLVDGDAVLEAHLAANPDARVEWDRFQKLAADPRVTRIGALLRRTSLDELPQLFNVLIGDMSLVGPRPPIPPQVPDYGVEFVFSQVRPGMTGLWQVSGRNQIDFHGRVNLDVHYVENWSFWYDIRILLKTFAVVVRGSGAY